MLTRDRSAPHTPYFAALNTLLRAQWPGKPALIVDLDRLDRNIERIRRMVNPKHTLRIVAKSLPSTDLLRYVLERTQSQALMVFDPDSAVELMALGPDYDLALGKPMPVQALDNFYRRTSAISGSSKIHWLIDSVARLEQYDAWARASGHSDLNVYLEIDVGLHRGGIQIGAEFGAILAYIAQSRLRLTGLMGYEVHLASATAVHSTPEAELARVQARYSAFVTQLHDTFPALAQDLVLNTGGSKTFHHYHESALVNDITVGSALVKPTQDDLPSLTNLEPAVFIATPVLKKLAGTTLPYLEWAAPLMERWNPNRATSLFVFGGGWLAEYESPAGLTSMSLYGFSTNHAHVNIGRHNGLSVDDYIFLRPTQSEKVMAEFDGILAVRNGTIEHHWSSW